MSGFVVVSQKRPLKVKYEGVYKKVGTQGQ